MATGRARVMRRYRRRAGLPLLEPSQAPLSPTFRRFVRKVKPGMRAAMVYAVVSASWIYGQERTTFSIPLSMGIMTAGEASKLTLADIEEAASLSLPTAGPVRVRGLVALRR